MAETEIRLELVWKCQSLLTWNFMSRRVRQKRISDLNQSGNFRASSRQTSCHGGLDSNRNQTLISLDMSELPQLNRNQTWISLEMSEPPNKKTSMSWRVRLLPKSDLNQFVHVRASSPQQKSDLNQSGNIRASSPQTSCYGGLDSNRNQTWISLDMSELPQLNRNQTWISLEMSELPHLKLLIMEG